MGEKFNGIIRGIREKNLESTNGMHIYKIKGAGAKYWQKRLENALNRGDTEVINYCLAQQEKCKINEERSKKSLQEKLNSNPEYLELQKRKEEIKSRILAIQKDSRLNIIQKSEMLRTLSEYLKQIDKMVDKMLNDIKNDLSARYESATSLFKDSYIEKDTVSTVGWDEIKKEKKSKENTHNESKSSKPEIPSFYNTSQSEIGTHSNSNFESTSRNNLENEATPKEAMTPDTIKDSITDFDKKFWEAVETPEEKVARKETEKREEKEAKIQKLKTDIEKKAEEIKKFNSKISELREPIKEKIEKLEQYEKSRQEHDLLCKKEYEYLAEIRKIDVYLDTVERYAEAADKNIETLEKSKKTIALVKKLKEAEKAKKDDEIEDAKKKLAEHLEKKVDELKNEHIDTAKKEAENEIETIKKGISFGLKDDGTLIPLFDKDKKSMKIIDFENLYKYIKENKDDITENLESSKSEMTSELENIKQSKPTLNISSDEYANLKKQLEIPLKAIDIYTAKTANLNSEKEAMEREFSDITGEKPQNVEETIEENTFVPEDVTNLVELYGITEEEARNMSIELRSLIDNEKATPKKEKEGIGK